MERSEKQKSTIATKVIKLRKNGSKRVQTINNEPSMTDGSFKEDCDVNTVMAKFMKTGHFPSRGEGIFADVSRFGDLQQAHDLLNDASDKFAQLGSDVREKFQNNPIKMIEFLQDPKNSDEAIKLGLLSKKEIVPAAQQSDENKPEGRVSKNKKTTSVDLADDE